MSVRITRMELLRLKRRIELAMRAKGLLEEKRNILVMEMLDFLREISNIQKTLDTSLAEVYDSLIRAQLIMGKLSFKKVSFNPSDRFRIEATTKSVVGVEIPVFSFAKVNELRDAFPYSFVTTSSELDKSIIKLEEVIQVIVDLAEAEAAIKDLAGELKRLKRRVNALEHIIIPRMNYTIRFIESRLEEMERESFFRLKRIKGILETRRKTL